MRAAARTAGTAQALQVVPSVKACLSRAEELGEAFHASQRDLVYLESLYKSRDYIFCSSGHMSQRRSHPEQGVDGGETQVGLSTEHNTHCEDQSRPHMF